ncbi:superantigen-like protein SSL4 [Oerskovia rustica]|uniref:LPXTG cell wall anchor domain-containing protein n=1 Tax=Oerskovia rustica TaxID=2762237 RepID=A0ABR8RP80_9CELL|nr:hypothetical protein [Oerskovia rustica]MBD7949529.1 hypothetical protein [Oerskovia rustica]
MSSTDAPRPHTFRTAVARTLQVGALALAVTATLPLVAQTAHAETAPGEPTCQDVGAADLGRGDDGRVEIGTTGLVLVLHRSVVSVEGDGPDVRSLTVVTAEGRELPGWGVGADAHDELNAPTYDHVRVCWEAPVTEQVEVPETTPTTVPTTQVDPPTTTPWTDLEEPTTTPWTQIAGRPGTTPTATVPTKRSTAAPETKGSTILEPTDEPTTLVDRKPTTPATTQEPTTPATPLVQPEIPGDVAEVADGTPTPAATTQQAAAQAEAVTQAEAPTERLVQTGAETMPLVVASTSLVVLGGVLLHLASPTRRRAARRRSARR